MRFESQDMVGGWELLIYSVEHAGAVSPTEKHLLIYSARPSHTLISTSIFEYSSSISVSCASGIFQVRLIDLVYGPLTKLSADQRT